jgi:hypothetical protein
MVISRLGQVAARRDAELSQRFPGQILGRRDISDIAAAGGLGAMRLVLAEQAEDLRREQGEQKHRRQAGQPDADALHDRIALIAEQGFLVGHTPF